MPTNYWPVMSLTYIVVFVQETFQARERKREANNLLHMEPGNGNSQIGSPAEREPIEIPISPQFTLQEQQQQAQGVNAGFSREQSVYSQASGYSQPSYNNFHHQRGAYM